MMTISFGISSTTLAKHLNVHYEPLSMIVFVYLQGAAFIQIYSDITGYLRDPWFRLFVTYPGLSFYVVSVLYQFIMCPFAWMIRGCSSIRIHPRLLVTVLVWVATVGLYQTLTHNRSFHGEPTTIQINDHRVGQLHIVQLTDIHLGGFMSKDDLYQIAEDVVSVDPDIVLLTGDFFTYESQRERNALVYALSPLKKLGNRVFACEGNHDHEVMETLLDEFKELGIPFLRDESTSINTTIGPIEIIGFRYDQGIESRYQHTVSNINATLRLIMLHHPMHFTNLPQVNDSIPEIVFSGHVHGGQYGLRELIGIEWSLVRLVGWVDQGLWYYDHGFKPASCSRKGGKCCMNRLLYVHPGTGFYGIPLRFGTRSEQSSFLIQFKK